MKIPALLLTAALGAVGAYAFTGRSPDLLAA